MNAAPAPSGPAWSGVITSSSPTITSVGAVILASSSRVSVSIMKSQAARKTSVVTLRAVTSRISVDGRIAQRVEVGARERVRREVQRELFAVDAVGRRERLPDVELRAAHAVAARDRPADDEPLDPLRVLGGEACRDEAAHGAAVHVQPRDPEVVEEAGEVIAQTSRS